MLYGLLVMAMVTTVGYLIKACVLVEVVVVYLGNSRTILVGLSKVQGQPCNIIILNVLIGGIHFANGN